jgi:hypothetical protein
MATQFEVAVHLDLTERQVRKIPLPRPDHRGAWDLDACRVVYIRHLRSLARLRNTEAPSLDEARLKNLEADTALKNARREEIEGRSIPRTAVNHVIDEFGASHRKRFESLGADVKYLLTSDPDFNQRVIDDEVRARQEELSHQPLEEAIDRAAAEESVPEEAEPEPEPPKPARAKRPPRTSKKRKRRKT